MVPRLWVSLFLPLWLVARPVRAEVPSARVAVIGGADQEGLASLVAAELSHDRTIRLVERDDLAKVGDELAIQRLAGSDALALGKLLGADGLVFITGGSAAFHVRLTAVGLGYVLFDDQIASSIDLPQLAKSVSHRVVGYGPKLKLDPTKAIPVSLLNLRANYGTAESTALERKLTLLLESGLAAVPEYVVLERRHAGSVAFERSLEPEDGRLLHGAYVIDGTLEMPAHGNSSATVDLRVRAPGSGEINRAVQGTPSDLDALVGKMVVEISKATGGTSPPPSARTRDEADEYLQEGLWGWRHSANEAALEALDSAELLGANSADVTVAQIGVLCALINQGLEIWSPKVTEQYKPAVDGPQLARKADHALRVIREVDRYRTEKLELRLAAAIADDPESRGNFTARNEQEGAIYPVSKLLVLLDEAGSPQADEVREALRSITGYDPLHGKTGRGFSTRVNNEDCSKVFADAWAHTLAEEWAYCRLASADAAYDPFALELATGRGRTDWTFCARFIPNRAKQLKLFGQFAQTLRDDPATRLTYLLLQTVLFDQGTADVAFGAYFDDLWRRRNELVVPGFPPEWVSARAIPQEVFDRNYRATLPLLRYDLTHASSLRFNRNPRVLLWRPENWSPEEAAELWKDYAGFRERATRNWVATHPQGVPDFSDYEKPFFQRFPPLAEPPPEPPKTISAPAALAVTRFWHPWLSTEWPYDFFMFGMMASDDGGVWLEGLNPGKDETLFRVGLPDFTTQIVAIPERRQAQTLVSTHGAIFATWETRGHNNAGEAAHQIARYDLSTSRWTTHNLPDYTACKLSGLRDSLYLFLQSRVPAYESAIARYGWDQDELVILSSTRRRPARNQFDDRQNVLDAQIFLGPGHRPCVNSLKDGTFYIREEPGPWPKAFDGGYMHYSISALGKTLVLDEAGRVVLLDPDRDAPELLLAPAGDARAVWNLPKDGKVWYSQVCLHDDRLFILEEPGKKAGSYDLVCYQRGKGRDPRHIPLEFRLDDPSRARLSVKPEHAPWSWDFHQIEHPDTTIYPSNFVHFQATSQGLYIQSENVGFWFLPYSDVDAYLKSSPN